MIELPLHVHAAARRYTDVILRFPNVVAVGVGPRRVGGRVTGDPAVVVSVSRKLPKDALRPDERVPAELESDGETVQTDVVEVAEPHFIAVDTAVYRRVRGGCQITTAGAAAGSGRGPRHKQATRTHGQGAARGSSCTTRPSGNPPWTRPAPG
jgi:hypothetical protein